ncbi:MAG: acyl carrier protein [Bdellovibrionales bacterium]|nr:acyl carrier protein [Bdellovibrionales bacterium]
MEPLDPILNYIRNHLLNEEASILPQTSLFDAKILDSMKLVELIGFLETRFKIRVLPSEVVVENLDSAERIAKYVERKLCH